MLDKYQEMPEWSSQLKQEYVASSTYVVVKSFSCPRMHLKHRSLRRDMAYGPVQHDVLTQSEGDRDMCRGALCEGGPRWERHELAISECERGTEGHHG